MNLISGVLQVLLAAVFTFAGAAKLSKQAEVRQTLRDFGVLRVLVTPTGFFLPVVELLTAAALLARPTVWWGAVVALGLLTLFTSVIALNLVLGRRPQCSCFGQVGARPIGMFTLARNAVLVAVAAFLVFWGQNDPSTGLAGWLAETTLAERVALVDGTVALGLGLIVLWLLVQLTAQQGRLLLRLDELEAGLATAGLAASPTRTHGRPPRKAGLRPGITAPEFRLKDSAERAWTLDDLRAPGRPVLLVFTDAACGPCKALLPSGGDASSGRR